jgi:lipoprotein-anchoring transpeptidase ErfK/SrfK
MGQAIRRWLLRTGALIAAAVSVIGLAGMATASPDGAAQATGPARATAPARAAAAAYVPPQALLKLGMHGPAVRRLQHRLAVLHYYPGAVDGKFGLDTLEAVWAFKTVQGLIINSANQDIVSRAAEHYLVHPRYRPRVWVPHGGSLRVEVNLRDEVLVLYKNNTPALITHVSTGAGCLPGEGCGWVTPTGNFRALSFFHGWETVPLGLMYNPVFFIGTAYAIHGEYDSSVPFYAASHGCVRVPFDVANVFHNMIRVPGTPIYIRR